VNTIVSQSGLIPVSGTPICMSWADTGDSENHVRPPLKSEYSARYLGLIKPYLNGPVAASP
jgi:hypothetical protein